MANNQLLASDNFANGSLAAGWSASPTESKCQVVAGTPNVTEPNALSTQAGQIWTALGALTDQISEITIQAFTSEAGTYIMPKVRWQSGTASGYQLNLLQGTVTVYRFDAGTPTQLSQGTGLTIAAGDVWAFVAAGSLLSVYQNWKRILYIQDATYATGYPGYDQYTTVNIAHTQVGSWRGYSLVQQDGVWQKQGIVIPGLSTDYTTNAGGTYTNTSVLYEGNAQLLSGTVYKMLFAAGTGSTTSIFYAESTDAKTWTRRSGAVLANYANPGLIKSGNTYYLYVQPSASAGTGNFALYTSTDMITWTQQSTTVIGLGTAGQWDAAFIWNFIPVAIVGGTWYALYSAGSNTTTFQFSGGLATSSDGVTWTKYGSNPVIADGYVGMALPVGSTYYAWVGLAQTGQGQTHPAEAPTQTIRWQSADLITWTGSAHSVHITEPFEGFNAVTGQSYPNSIINVGSFAYMYLTSSQSDNTVPTEYGISLAIAPTSLANLVRYAEDGTAQLATDNFTRANGSLGANWTTPTGGTALQIASNTCEPTSTTLTCVGAYTAIPSSANHYSEITIATMSATLAYCQPTVRMQTGAVSYYTASMHGATGSQGTVIIGKTVSGTFTQIGPAVPFTPAVNDVFRLSVFDGSDGTPVLTLFQNGFQILQVQDYSKQFASGYPGIAMFDSVLGTAQISLWAGGNANVIPNYPTAYNSFLGESAVEAIELEAYSWGEFHVAPRWKK